MTDQRVPGARWLRCDLHVHTPFDVEKRFGENLRAALEALKKEKPQRLAEIAERFIGACRSAADGAGIDVVALTDHNNIDGYRYLKPQFDALAQQAADQGLSMPAILPGCELSVGGERPIHFLVIFAAETDLDGIDRALGHVFGTNDRFDPKTGTPRATGQSVDGFLERLFDYCRPVSGDRHMEFVVLPAHADDRCGVLREVGGGVAQGSNEIVVSASLWDEMKGHLRQRVITRRDWNGFQTMKPFGKLPQAYRELLWRWAAARRGEDWEQIAEGQRARYREQQHWPLVECSDPHNYETIGSSFSWLKMEVPDIEGIRLALLDPASRLRRMAEGPPGQAYPRIERLRVRETDFFKQIEVPLNPCLTTLIGGRGTGKSTLLEYLRYVLDRARPMDFPGEAGGEIRKSVQSVLDIKSQRDHGETPGTLLPSHAIEVDLVVAERRYRIRRTKTETTVERDPDSADAETVPLDIRSLIAPRVLSQRQIARIARDAASQRSELDRLLDPEALQVFFLERRTAADRLEELQKKRARLEARQKQLPAKKTELQKVNDQIAFLEKAGRKDVLSRFQDFEKERHWLDGVVREIETQAVSLGDQSAATRASIEQLHPVPESTVSKDWIDAVARRVQERISRTADLLLDEAAVLRAFSTEIGGERAKQWQPSYDDTRKEYEDLRAEMVERGVDFAQHEKLLQQRVLLEREVSELQRIGEELSKVEDELRNTHSALVQAHERRLALRRSQAGVLEEMDADVRLEVLPFRDRRDFEARRDDWLAGAGVQERDWEKLGDYIFSGGSIPDRLAAVVEALRTDLDLTAELGRSIAAQNSSVASLLGGAGCGLTGHFYRALERRDRIRLDEMERFLPEDTVEARVRSTDGSFKPIMTGSVGQRSTAILSLLLSAGDQPLLIDQPEDDLDNSYVYAVVVSLLRRRKFCRQIVIATHNANIPVNGDAELIVALGTEEQLGTTLCAGSIDRKNVKERVSVIMEGSEEAFRLRRERYGF